MSNQVHNATEAEARELAEQSRQTSWEGRSFVRELFLGTLRMDWISPFPDTPDSKEFNAFYAKMRTFLEERVDSTAIDETGEYPPEVIDGLRKLGAFGMKIDKKYGGLGFAQTEYVKLVELVSAYDGNLGALLSAHQSIGLPQPLKLFGTPEQKQAYLPRCAAGAISAFALTEPDVGSDPARLATTAVLSDDGKHYVLNGTKLWITNGTVAELMVVMARHPETRKISAFIVEMATPGISVDHRCRFMGLRALENGVIRFTDVAVPVENLIGNEGQGLKIALITLNTGRLSLPAGCLGGAKKALNWCRTFANERVQWGAPIGRHEAITHKLADMAATTWAMESFTRLAAELSTREGYDIRLEAAAAKEWASTRGWDLTDDAVQIRGGRAYERASSLQARGEDPIPLERMMRDSRINRIFEGSSEIMHLFMAREMVDKHLQVAGTMLDAKASTSDKLAALPKILAFYGAWYPRQWFGLAWTKYGEYGKLAKHLRFAERRGRRLARSVFHLMLVHQAKLEKKQAVLFRTVDIAVEIAVIAATVARTQRLAKAGDPSAAKAVELADLYCRNASRKIDGWFRDLWRNDDARKYQVGRHVLDGGHDFVEYAAYLPADLSDLDSETTAAK